MAKETRNEPLPTIEIKVPDNDWDAFFGGACKTGLVDNERPVIAFEGYEIGHYSYHPLIRDAIIKDPLKLERYFFPRGISFVHCTFLNDVDFSAALFEGPAYFWNCSFLGSFSFFRAMVGDDGCKVEFREQGEVNFSYSYFNCTNRYNESLTNEEVMFKQPSFDRATFFGPAFFHRTIFVNGVSAEECRFKCGARFESYGSDICVHKDEVAFLDVTLKASQKKTILSKLSSEAPRVLSISTDDIYHYNFDIGITSISELSDAILNSLCENGDAFKNSGWNRIIKRLQRYWNKPADQILRSDFLALDLRKVTELWRDKFLAEMFGGTEAFRTEKWTTSFRGTYFGPGSRFSHVALSNCYFMGAELREVEFRVVDWVRQPCGLVFRRIPDFFREPSGRPSYEPELKDYLSLKAFPSWRSAVRDELKLDSEFARAGSKGKHFRMMRKELTDLYHALRNNSDAHGDSESARDFYFGELEARRLSKVFIARWFSFLNLYKWVSGYSKREGLTLAWLLTVVFALSPRLYYSFSNRPEAATLSRTSPPPASEAIYFEPYNSPYKDDSSIDRKSPHPFPYYPLYAMHELATQSTRLLLIGENDSAASSQVKLAPGCHLTLATSTADQERLRGAIAWALDALNGSAASTSRYLRVLGSSMRASTFVPASAQPNSMEAVIQMLHGVDCNDYKDNQFYSQLAISLSGSEGRRHGLEALERATGAALLALFLLALRSKIQRTR